MKSAMIMKFTWRVREAVKNYVADFFIINIIFSSLGKKFPEKLSGLSVKGGVGVPPISAKGFLEKWFSVKGVGGGVPP